MSLEAALQHRPTIAPVDAAAARPLWSVMIPTYNCKDTLRQTLRSVLASGWPAADMQILVVDDASTEPGVETVVAEIGQGRVGFHRQARNRGHVENFNTCLRLARGRLVHILHGDDWVEPGFYAAMAQLFADHPQIGAGFCRHVITYPDGVPQRVSPIERPDPGVLAGWRDAIAAECRLQTPAMVVRREVYERLGGFDSRMKCCGEDWEMWARIAAHYPTGFHPGALACYRDAYESLTKRSVRSGQNIRDIRMAVRIIARGLPGGARDVARRGRANVAKWGLDWAAQLAGRGHYRHAAVQLFEALRSDQSPATLRAARPIVYETARGIFRRRAHAALRGLRAHA